MRILGAVFFLSLLAGKLKIFKQMLRSNFFKKSWRMRILGAVFFLSLMAGKLNFGKGYHERKFATQFCKNKI